MGYFSNTNITLLEMEIKLNFEKFDIPAGIDSKMVQRVDARETFANLIYRNVNGIRAHALALKIYRSRGAEEYDHTEVSLILSIANKYCTPAFIDGLRIQIQEITGNEFGT